MNKPLFISRLLTAGAALLSSCVAVYVPTTPSTPLLERGQVEVTAGLRSIRYGEVGAAWSPVNHLLVTGELAADLATSTSTSTNGQGVATTYTDSHRQGGVGVGYYLPPGTTRKTYLAAVAGTGWGSSHLYAFEDFKAASVFFPFPVPTRNGVYDARYRRYYGQVYFAGPADEKGRQFGASLRTVWLDYTRLTFADQPIAPANRVFLEPSVFMRFGKGPLRFFATAGLSMPLSSDPANPANARTASMSYLFSGGLVLRPDLLRHRE